MSSERFSLTEVVSILQNEDMYFEDQEEDETGSTNFEFECELDDEQKNMPDANDKEQIENVIHKELPLNFDLDSFAIDENLKLPLSDFNNNSLEAEENVESESEVHNSFSSLPLEVSESTGEAEAELPKRGRKRIRNEENWKQNVRKRKRQAGESYTSTKGNVKRAREIKTTKDCEGKCKYHCGLYFSQNQRKEIFNNFWKLSDTEKNSFYGNTTDCQLKERKRGISDRKKKTIKYYLVKDMERVRVCKEFYLSTLDISNKRIDYYHRRGADARFLDKRGKNPKKKTPQETIDKIKKHINSFPRTPSHYCRASTTKEYLEAGLSLQKMHDLYKVTCEKEGTLPAKIHTYRRVFNTEFNIDFFVPKKDRCDTCEEYRVLEAGSKDIPPIKITEHDKHLQDKLLTKQERDKDRTLLDRQQAVISFDMQNVITCPRSNISNFFYKRKLNMFNLTAHCNIDCVGYNVVWNETFAGRGANEIASAVLIVLEKVLEKHPFVTSFILWSDSCVPQNRNSIICLALKKFMESHESVTSIIQKFGTPGHSAIQEVDNIHSHLEKAFKVSDMYSPISVIRTMNRVRPEKMIVTQMKSSMIFDFQASAVKLLFKQVPFSKLKCLLSERSKPFIVSYKLSFDSDFIDSVINRTTRKSCGIGLLPDVKQAKYDTTLSSEKVKDLKSMLKYMPQDECLYMKKLCKL